jgi:hypothetical protein
MTRFRQACDQLCQVLQSKPNDQGQIHSHLTQLVGSLTWQSTQTSDALEQERAIIDARIRNFDINSSPPYAVFQAKGWNTMKFPEMVSVCEVLAKEGRVTMDREAKRRKPVLFKWMSDNWEVLKLHIDNLELVFGSDDECD